jgi:DNA-binding transcriptional MocR family regulator
MRDPGGIESPRVAGFVRDERGKSPSLITRYRFYLFEGSCKNPRQRRAALVTSLVAAFGDRMTIGGTMAGLHLVLWLDPQVSLERIVDVTRQAGIELCMTAEYTITGHVRPGFLLGFALARSDDLRAGVERLQQTLTHLL